MRKPKPTRKPARRVGRPPKDPATRYKRRPIGLLDRHREKARVLARYVRYAEALEHTPSTDEIIRRLIDNATGASVLTKRPRRV